MEAVEEMAALREMLQALNQMIKEHQQGGRPDFEGFMQQFGQMFGDNSPQSFDELMEQLQQQLAQMQSMLDSMSPEARREMEDALAQALDPETQQFFREVNPWALKDIVERLLEAMQRGLWESPPDGIRETLQELYLQLEIDLEARQEGLPSRQRA